MNSFIRKKHAILRRKHIINVLRFKLKPLKFAQIETTFFLDLDS